MHILLNCSYDFHLAAGDNGNVYGFTDGIDAQNRTGRPIGSQVFAYDAPPG